MSRPSSELCQTRHYSKARSLTLTIDSSSNNNMQASSSTSNCQVKMTETAFLMNYSLITRLLRRLWNMESREWHLNRLKLKQREYLLNWNMSALPKHWWTLAWTSCQFRISVMKNYLKWQSNSKRSILNRMRWRTINAIVYPAKLHSLLLISFSLITFLISIDVLTFEICMLFDTLY